MGKPAIEVWGEIWQYIEIPLQEAMNGIPVERHEQLLFFERLQDGGPNNHHEVCSSASLQNPECKLTRSLCSRYLRKYMPLGVSDKIWGFLSRIAER